MKDVTVSMIGLGRMGSALVRGFLSSGSRVTVWNRDPNKAHPLGAAGARVATSLAEALSASELIAVSVPDYKTSHSLLFSSDAEHLLRGKTIVEFTTGTPVDARTAEAKAKAAAADYLDSAVMCYPSGVGTPEATLLFSGSKQAFDRYEPALRSLGGNVMYLGENVAAAATLDLALLDYYYGAVAAMLHGFSICESEGFPLESYAQALEAIAPLLSQTAQIAAKMIPARSYAGTEATNDVHAAALAKIVLASQDAKLDPFPARVMDYFNKALAKGYGPDEIPALYETMRPRIRSGKR